MTDIRIVQIDAFASTPFEGNPAAVMPLDAWLDDATLQAIAEENNLSETAHYIPTDDPGADYELRWFTPTAEVAMCGHATLASGHLILSENPEMDTVRFRTRKAGVLEVRRADAVYELDLPATISGSAEHSDLLTALGTPEGEVFMANPDSAEDTAIILLPDADAVRKCSPDFKALADIHLMAIVTATGDDGRDVISRVFVPAWGIDEDPVTGSAHAALAPFWADRLGRSTFTALQASKRTGELTCRLDGDRVILGGQCVTVIEGVFKL